ncbi:hypothetical protein GALMADRAFT_132312 [Galerina marginata CBS 339.88]|uniref:BHLH domain-containing protein n=1 Tax=Galerina marginata (strain CBS 339.88) TaxID=685588 RepID=A0A067U2L9_GALM3|nr:hypothetical protein GALMADRAFT_132312 [Galerina marginata CBS 339.88]
MEQHPMNDDNGAINHQTSYNFYSSEQDPAYSMAYSQPLTTYPQALQHTTGTRNQMVPDLHQSYHPLNTLGLQQHQYQAGVFATSPPHGSLPLSNSPPPPSPEMYDPLSPPLSGSDTSGDGLYHHSNSSGANSPSPSRAHSLVHRSNRYNPTPSPTSSSSRRRSRSQDSDDDDMGVAYVENLANSRKEATRRQRIEAEQRRRDELRDGYAKLKDALPVSNQKSSKVSLLERATNHIIALEKENKELQQRITFMEQESQRLRALNEKISLSTEGTPSPENNLGRPISPPPDAAPTGHSLVPVRGQQPPSEHSSPSASEEGH